MTTTVESVLLVGVRADEVLGQWLAARFAVGGGVGDAVGAVRSAGPFDAVVYRPAPGDDPEAVLGAVADAGASAAVLLSSARVYGASPRHDMLLDEATPVSDRLADPTLRAVAEADRAWSAAVGRRPGLRVVVLRPVHVLGPTADSMLARYVGGWWAPASFGFDPLVPVVHEDDVAQAVERVLTTDVEGVFNVTGSGGVPLSVLARERGVRRAHFVPRLVLDVAAKLGVGPVSSRVLPELRFMTTVDGERLRSATGYAPRRSVRDTVRWEEGWEESPAPADPGAVGAR